MLLLGCFVYVIPVSMLSKARSVPRIHDITTDTQNLPRFVDIVALQKKPKAATKSSIAVRRLWAGKKGLPPYPTAR